MFLQTLHLFEITDLMSCLLHPHHQGAVCPPAIFSPHCGLSLLDPPEVETSFVVSLTLAQTATTAVARLMEQFRIWHR